MDCLVYLGIHICCPDWNCCRFWCYLSSLKYVSAVIVGLMVCFEPLSAYLLSVFAFDLRIGLWEAAGICLVLLNVLVLSLPKKSTKAVKP